MAIAGGKSNKSSIVVDPETYRNYDFKDLSTKELLELRPRATSFKHLLPQETIDEFYRELNSREHIRTKEQAKADRKAEAHRRKYR